MFRKRDENISKYVETAGARLFIPCILVVIACNALQKVPIKPILIGLSLCGAMCISMEMCRYLVRFSVKYRIFTLKSNNVPNYKNSCTFAVVLLYVSPCGRHI